MIDSNHSTRLQFEVMAISPAYTSTTLLAQASLSYKTTVKLLQPEMASILDRLAFGSHLQVDQVPRQDV